MTRTKVKDLDYFVQKVESRLLKKFPYLELEVIRRNDREAAIYYLPYLEKDDVALIQSIGPVAADAIDEGIRLWLFPGQAPVDADPPDDA